MRKTIFFLCLLCMGMIFPLSANAKSEEQYKKEIQLLKKQIAKMTEEAENSIKEVKETREAIKILKKQLKNCVEQQPGSEVVSAEKVEESVQLIQKLQKDLKDAESTINKQQQTIEILKKKKLGDAEKELSQELKNVQAELQKQRQQFKATLELLHDRDVELKKADATIQKLMASGKTGQPGTESEAKLAEVNAKLLQMAQEKAQLESQLQQLQRRRQDRTKDAEIARLEDELRKAAGLINTCHDELTAVKADQTELQAQLKNMTQSEADLESELIGMRTAKTDVEVELTEKLRKQTQEIEQLKSKIETLQMSLEQAEQKNVQFTKTVADLEARLLEKHSVPDAAKKRIAEISQELQDVRAQLDTQQRMQKEYPKLKQEATACRERVEKLTEENERQHKKIQSLQTELNGIQLALDQSRQELDAVTTQNLDFRNQLKNQSTSQQSQDQKISNLSSKNQELEQKYAKSTEELKLKEQLLQKVLTEKSLSEKKLDEEKLYYKELQNQLQQAKTQIASLQTQLEGLQKAGSQMVESQQETTSAQSALEQQVLRERALRKQVETNLMETRRQAQRFQEQVSALSAQLMKQEGIIAPVQTLPADGATGSIRALFTRQISQSISGSTITILGQSVNRTKVAYQESSKQIERLWIINTQTQQPVKITEWQSPAPSLNSQSRFAWAPDNEHFLFATGYPKKYVLYLGNSNGLIGTPVSLYDYEVQFAWSPVRLQFAYFSGTNLIVKDLKGGALPIQIGHTPGTAGTSLQWSPNGTMLAISMKRDTNFDIFTLMFSGEKPLLQTLVASAADDILPSWSPDGKNIAFYVRSDKYDTKIAITPLNRTRAPYVVAHKTSLPRSEGPLWLTNTEILYVGEEHSSASQNSVYTIDIASGRRASAPMTTLLAY